MSAEQPSHRAPLPGADAQQHERAEEEQRVELRGDRQPQHRAGERRAARRPGGDGERGQRDSEQVPVDVRGEQQRGGQRHHQADAQRSSSRRVRRGEDGDDREDGEDQRGHVVERDPACVHPERLDEPRDQLHEPAAEHRILDVVDVGPGERVEVRDLAVAQPAHVVQRVDVGVAGIRRRLDEVEPHRRAGLFLQPAEQAHQRGEAGQHRGEPHQPTAGIRRFIVGGHREPLRRRRHGQQDYSPPATP